MVVAKTGVATGINEIESLSHLTHCHGKAIKIMRDTLYAAFELNKLIKVEKSLKKFKYSLKREGGFNGFRENSAPGNSYDRALFSSLWVVRWTLLQNILDNWAVFQELRDGILEN